MTKHTLIIRAIFSLFLSLTPLCCAGETPPNVVLIFADDLGYGDLGCYGATKLQTPNIDTLAREGRRFTDAHSASAVCTPSRFGLLTGKYPIRAMSGQGTWGPLSPTSGLIIDTKTTTIGKVFKDKGYATAAFGKWHLGFKKGKNDWQVPLRPGPQDLGFDHYFGVPQVNSGSPFVYVENDTVVGHDPTDPLVYGGKPVSPTPTFPEEASRKSPNRFAGALKAHQIYDDEKTATLLTEKAVNWIAEKKDEPFFLYFPTPNIHHPFTPAPRFKGTSQCGLYGDFVHELDWMVGELMKCLDENGLSDNTLVIFTSDNGGMLNLAGRNAMNAGHKINGDLLGFKFGVWEGGHRVPFIARWPGKIEAGTQSDQLISQVDMLATFTALTGQDTDKPKNKDSINMLPALIEDPSSPLRTELLLAPRQPRNLAIRAGKWVYIGAKGSGGFTGGKPSDHAWGGPPAVQFAGSTNSDIANGRLKKDAPIAQLYDLENDPNQTRNVHDDNPEVVKEMQARLDAFRPKKVSAPKKRLPRKKKPNANIQPKAKVQPNANAQPNAVSMKVKTAADEATQGRPPNVVFIFIDDMGYGDIGPFGSTTNKTPRLDQMAAEGLKLTDFYVSSTACSPSRSALLTGCYADRVGMDGRVCFPGQAKGLNPAEITIAEMLKAKGYATGCFGKWHLGDMPQFMPLNQGFDVYEGIPYSNDMWPLLANKNFPPLPYIKQDKAVAHIPDAPSQALLCEAYTNATVQFIKQHRDKPFFAYVPHSAVHLPRLVTKQEGDRADGDATRAQVEAVDASVGRIIDTLNELGIAKNTLVFFTSDNGPSGGLTSAPLRGGKGGPRYEGNMRMPTLAWWPGKIAPGTVCSEIGTTTDVLPTLAKLCGAEVPTDRVIDGKDISSLLTTPGAKSPHEVLYYEYEGIRQGNWKLVNVKKSSLLFDLGTDIGERKNLAAKHPEKVAAMRKLLSVHKKNVQSARRPAGMADNPQPILKEPGDLPTLAVYMNQADLETVGNVDKSLGRK